MFDKDVVLEGLGAICNAKVTSVQQQTSVAGFTGLLASFQHLFVAAPPNPPQLSLTQLISTVVDGDQTCPVSRSNFLRIQHILHGGERPADPVSFSGDQSGTGLPSASQTFQLENWENNRNIVIDEDQFFDPRFNYDFTGLKDTDTYYRGDEEYKRPCGWQRFALKVLDKYDGNEWLGTTGRSTQSVPGEWPVSYHGTSKKGAEGIIEGFYKPGDGAAYGTGIYSTPDINVAKEDRYSKRFKSKNGKTYKVILQNRINPKYRKICSKKDYWLIHIKDGLTKEEEEKWVERAIRPYGLLLKEV